MAIVYLSFLELILRLWTCSMFWQTVQPMLTENAIGLLLIVSLMYARLKDESLCFTVVKFIHSVFIIKLVLRLRILLSFWFSDLISWKTSFGFGFLILKAAKFLSSRALENEKSLEPLLILTVNSSKLKLPFIGNSISNLMFPLNLSTRSKILCTFSSFVIKKITNHQCTFCTPLLVHRSRSCSSIGQCMLMPRCLKYRFSLVKPDIWLENCLVCWKKCALQDDR